MPWCPKCKNEYVEGRKVCADCGVELVDSLEEGKCSPVIFGEQDQMERLKDYLKYNGITSAETGYDEADGVYEVYVSAEERKKASLAVNIFLEEERTEKADSLMPEAEGDIPEHPAAPLHKGVYQDSAKKAEENRSSAYMLLIIGGAGLAAVVLIFAGIIKIPMAALNKYMTCGVMGGLFVLFMVMGILSMKSSRVLAKKAESENSLSSELRKWCGENLTAETVDGDLFIEEDSGEEIKYFKRIDKMKQMISHQFMNLDEGFLDSFVDDFYPVIFD